jgi:hypothetical protein
MASLDISIRLTRDTKLTDLTPIACEAGAVTLGAAALANPVGAMGGILYSMSNRMMLAIAEPISELWKGTHPAVDRIMRVALFCLAHFASWGVMALAGFSMTLPHMLLLSACGIVGEQVGDVVNNQILSPVCDLIEEIWKSV